MEHRMIFDDKIVDLRGPEWKRWYDRWDKFVDELDMSRHDSMLVEFDYLLDFYRQITDGDRPGFSARLLQHPALKNYVLRADTAGHKFAIFYTPSILPRSVTNTNGLDGIGRVMPVIDAYVSIDGGENLVSIVTIGFNEEKPGVVHPLHATMYFTNEKDKERYELYARTAVALYYSSQALLVTRKEIFEEESVPGIRQHTQPKKGKGKNKRNKVKILRIIRQKKEYLPSGRKITKDCWGVIGHVRRYKKSGKEIWIEPYKKGRKRDDPNVYCPKDYVRGEEKEVVS